MVDVSVLKTLPVTAAGGKYSTIIFMYVLYEIQGTRNACKVLVKNPKGRRLLGRLRHRWDDNIKIVLKEIVWEDVDWIYLTEDRTR
jgi:hypothetical protein